MRNDPMLLQPVQRDERIVSLDVIRALALFGVLLVNLPSFSGARALSTLGQTGSQSSLDSWITGASQVLITGKAWSCFAMLFGIGLFMQFERTHERGRSAARFALRRLGGLFLIGFAHWVLVWEGDILMVYALVGFTLLPLIQSRLRVLLIVALAAFLLSDALVPLLRAIHAPTGLNVFGWAEVNARGADAACGHGSWISAMGFRLSHWGTLFVPSYFLAATPFAMPMFMIGALVWRTGLIRHPQEQSQRLRRWFHSSFWLGAAISLIAADPMHVIPEAWKRGWEGVPWLYFSDTGMYLMAFGYFTGLIRLLAQPNWNRPLSVLAPMGRMALTNYLSQSLVFTWVFYSHGLGFWGKGTPTALLLCALGFCGIQILWSHWWLARFRFGPAEWLWRSMTYGAWQPFVIRQNSPSPLSQTASDPT